MELSEHHRNILCVVSAAAHWLETLIVSLVHSSVMLMPTLWMQQFSRFLSLSM